MTTFRFLLAFLFATLWCAVGIPADVSFQNDVMTVLAKAGCNQGTCHGNANGKGGLKLSLRGYDPAGDYQVLTRQGLGRRISPGDPDSSLLLLKPTMALAHEGGRRFTQDSAEYQILHDWIAAGAPFDRPDAVRIVRIEVTPRQTVLLPRELQTGTEASSASHHWQQSLTVAATLSDGSQRDVTSLAVYEPSSPAVEISPAGQVTADEPGEVTIIVRLGGLTGQSIPVRLAFILGDSLDPATFSAARNEVDQFIFDKLRMVRIPPSAVCNDVTFLRRAYLDLLGLLPTASEARDFVSSSDVNKREHLVEQLLERAEFAEFWALKWADLLRAEETTLDRKGVENLFSWLKHQFSAQRPLDAICRDLVSARGSTYSNPASNYYRALRDPVTRAESTAQIMLGVRLQCAKCHNHPFDHWTQDDYYGWAGLFARVDYKVLENNRRDDNNKHEFVGEQIVFLSDAGAVDDPRSGMAVSPLMLGASSPLGSDADPLEAAADWITAPENPYFAKVQVNRIWYHLMGRGIVDPIDDFRLTNPPSHPELLDWLAQDFIDHGCNLHRTIRLIMNSQTYQLSSASLPANARDEINYSHGFVRRLSAEQLLDNISRVTHVPLQFNGYPEGLRSAQLAGVQAVRSRDQAPASADKFLVLFGKPKRLQSCDCERTSQATLAQTFQMISGPLLDGMLADSRNILSQQLQSNIPANKIAVQLYWSALSRPPTDYELQSIQDRLSLGRPGLEDLLWGLLNSNEFLLRP